MLLQSCKDGGREFHQVVATKQKCLLVLARCVYISTIQIYNIKNIKITMLGAQSTPSTIFSVLGFGKLDFVNFNIQSFIFCVQDAWSSV